jgi:hypothetical protein
VKALKLNNVLILKFESKSRRLFSNKMSQDFFVVSITLDENLKYKILFYNEVDELFYSYREIDKQKNFHYVFSELQEKLPTLEIETSCQMANLHRYKFKALKELKIKVNLSD